VLTEEALRATVAELLQLRPGEIPETENLLESGMDSIRLLTLLELCRNAGAEISFVQLAEEPTIKHWTTLTIAA
jgi:bifunctional isochorismate lyase/aryl carrier protein